MEMKKLFSVIVMLLLTLVTIAGASAKVLNSTESALPIVVDWVKVDGDELNTDVTVNDIDRNDAYEVKVKLIAVEDLEDVSVEVAMYGYDQNDQIYDAEYEKLGDMETGHADIVKMSLNLPYRLDSDDEYGLKVTIHDKLRYHTVVYVLHVEAEEHNMMIKDVVFSPSGAVQAGKSLLTTVYFKNIGAEEDADGLRVSIDVPGVGSNANWVDELDSDESTSSEQLYLPVPVCTPAGEYDAVITVEFKDGDKKVSTTKKITVLDSNSPCGGDEPQTQKTIITVGTATQDVVQGEGGAIYPLTLSNAGTESKIYVVSVDGYQDWATISLSPSNVVVVDAGEAKAVYAYVTALETATAGEHMFSLTVKSGDETLKQFPVKANVVGAAEDGDGFSSVKKGLEIGLIVLIVLLVILGLIIGFNKLRGDEDEDDLEEDKTYY